MKTTDYLPNPFAPPKILERLQNMSRKNKKLSGLDIGSSVPSYMFDLIINIGLNKATCIDKSVSEEKAIEYYTKYNNELIFKNCKTIKECFLIYLRKRSEQGGHLNQTEEELISKFDKLFHLHFNSDITKFDLGKISKQNIVLCQNLIHFLPHEEGKNVCIKLAHKLKNNGLFFLEVNHFENPGYMNKPNSEKINDYTYFDKNSGDTFYLYDENKFLQLTKTLEQNGVKVFKVPELYKNGNKSISMNYVGIKN